MKKYLSSLNYASQYASNRQGYLLGIEMYPFFKKEAMAGVFTAPNIGTAGRSVSAATPSQDLTLVAGDNFNVSVNGGAVVNVLLDTSTLDTANLIVNALETGINNALSLTGQLARVWVEFDAGLYKIHSQNVGERSSVVVTDGATDDVAVELKLGVANAGVETAGTYSADFAYVRTAGFNFSQEIEMSEHRSGRQASNFYKSKKMVEGDTEMYILLGEEGSNVIISDAHKMLFESCFGRIVMDTANELTFDCSQPHNVYFSAVLVNNGLGQIVNGGYARNWALSLAGDSPASLSIGSKGRDSKMASIAKVQSAVTTSTTVVTTDKEAKRFEAGSVVMITASNGTTVTYGGEGNLTVVSVNDETNTLVLSSPVSIEENGFVVPWSPAYFGGVPSDTLRIATDLEGGVSMDGGVTYIGEVTNAEVTVENNLTDLDNYYGADANVGFVDGSRQEITLSLTLNMTVEEVRKLQLMKDFRPFNVLLKVGGTTGQRMEIGLPRVIFNIPPVELPPDGPVSLTFEGQALQTETGAMDAIRVSFKNN